MPRNFTDRSTAGPRRRALLAATAVALFVTACDDPFRLRAERENADQPFEIFAISGTAINAPAAISFVNRTVVRVDGSFLFDLAFDINKDGKPVVMPVGQVGTPLNGAPLIGLQRVSGGYDNLKEAPNSGYHFDSTMVVNPGAAIAIQAQQGFCATSFTGYIFAKVVIDSVDLSTRKLFGRTMINLNCGFRQLTPGLPSF
jgi:hypothetical protein